MSEQKSIYIKNGIGSVKANEVDLAGLKDALLYRRIIRWGPTYLLLDNDFKVFIAESDSDCCASADGSFEGNEVVLDAVITDVVITEAKCIESDDDGYGEWSAELKIYHNQNPVAIAEATANNGNGGYYYSVASVVVVDRYDAESKENVWCPVVTSDPE